MDEAGEDEEDEEQDEVVQPAATPTGSPNAQCPPSPLQLEALALSFFEAINAALFRNQIPPPQEGATPLWRRAPIECRSLGMRAF